MSVTIYEYPKCSTCRNAKKWLDEHNMEYNAIHIVENPPSKEEIKELYKKSGLELKKFFNTSGKKYRELGLKDKVASASNEELFDGEKVTVGFKDEMFQKEWK
jgi:arsenate reductase